MPNGMFPVEYATMPNSNFNNEEHFVADDGVETSEVVFFAHNRLGMRLETQDGRVFLFGLNPEQERVLREALMRRCSADV